MPSVGEVPVKRLRRHSKELERLLKPPILTDEERGQLHASDVEEDDRTKDDWWKRLSELKSYARRKEAPPVPKALPVVDEGPLLAALSDEPVEVRLTWGKRVLVRPASLARIMVIEDLEWWARQLEVFRIVLRQDMTAFETPWTTVWKIRQEATRARRWLYVQVCAPSPQPVDFNVEKSPPLWSKLLTAVDEQGLLNAWLKVNVNRIRDAEEIIRQKYPIKPFTDDPREQKGSLQGFAFLMAGAAYREKKAPSYVIRDRSLSEVFTTYTAASRQSQHSREESEKKSEAKQKKAKARNRSRGRRR